MTKAQIIDGRSAAQDIRARVAKGVQALYKSTKVIPGLAVILVGQNPASVLYVQNKRRAALAVGIQSFVYELPEEVRQEVLLELIQTLNKDIKIHAILIQLPLPHHINTNAVLEAVDPLKDVDGFHPVNAGRLAQGFPGIVPCTPLGCLMLLKRTLGKLEGRHAVVVGRSRIVGRPMAQLLLIENCTVTLAHSYTLELESYTRQADILVVAVGKPEMVRGHWIKPGAVVIDVGITRVLNPQTETTHLVGDVCFQEAQNIAGAITPVPGGVGPMTIACLLLNTIKMACHAVGFPYFEEGES